jgi:hypothetical protein
LRLLERLKNKALKPTSQARPRFLNISKDLWLSALVASVVLASGYFIGWANYTKVRAAPMPGYHYIAEPHNPLSFMASWDAPDYLSIAHSGYINQFWTNWFPLYPILINAASHVIPSPLDAAILISWLSLIGALYFFIKISRVLFGITDDFEPLRAVMFFVLFPTAVFLIAPFTESLFAFLTLGAIYFALQKRWIPSALFLMFCTAAHVTGPLVAILVALILLEQKLRLRYVILTALIGSLGLLSYMAFLYFKFNNPISFVEAQATYHGWGQNRYLTLITSSGFVSTFFIILIVLSAIYWWKRRKSFAIYSLLYLAIPLLGKQYGGFNRYVLMAFPIQFMLYGFFRDKKTLYPYVTAVLGILWAYFVLQYAGGYIGS